MTTIEEEVSSTGGEVPWHLSGNNAPVFDEVTVTNLSLIHI